MEESPFHLQIDPVVPLDVLLLQPLLVDDLERLPVGYSHMTFAVRGEGVGWLKSKVARICRQGGVQKPAKLADVICELSCLPSRGLPPA